MEQYAEVVGEEASQEDYLRIATHFVRKADHFRAGQFFHKAGEYARVRVHTHTHTHKHTHTHTHTRARTHTL